jgi:fatty-acyl-CoA synthase
MDFPLNVGVILRRAEQLYGHKPVLSRRPDRSWATSDYGTVIARSKRLARALKEDLGLVDGDRVATLCWNHAEHLEVYLGVPASGLVVHTLNLRLHPDDIAYVASHAGDRVLVADKALWPLVTAFADRAGFKHLIAVGEGPTPEAAIEYADLVGRDAPGYAFPDVDENAAAGMCYTSGTTGHPKGVVYSHRAIVLHSLATSLADVLELREADVVLPVVPMFHANAWGFPFSCALAGATQVFPGPHLDGPSLLDAFAEHRVTIAAGVPTIWLGLLKALDENPGGWDLSALRTLVVGGAAPPPAMIQGFEERHGLRMLHAWGMTETAPIGTVAAESTIERDLDAAERLRFKARQGRPAPLVEIRARGEESLVPWDGQTMGELEVRGAWVSSAYHEASGSEERWTDDGWFRTGDIVTIDPTGVVEIQDRAKDLVKSGGEWISTVALENALMGHPAVAEAAVIAVADETWSERPLAVVVLREGAAASADELRELLGARFAKWWVPERIEFVTEIPKTAVGKFKKTALREQFT